MSRVITALCILVFTAGFVGFHTYQILDLDKDISAICDRVETQYESEDWDRVRDGLKELESRWNQSRFWACLTVDTAEIEEIEIALQQSMKYAEIHDKEDFIGIVTRKAIMQYCIDHYMTQELDNVVNS